MSTDSLYRLTFDDLWGHVADGSHGVGHVTKGTLKFLGRSKVTQLQFTPVVEEEDTGVGVVKPCK